MFRRLSFYIAVLMLLFLAVRLLTGFAGLYGQDAFEYLRYAGNLRAFILEGTHPGDYFWPVGYPLAGALLSLVLKDPAVSLQFVSFFSLILVFIYAHKILGLIFPGRREILPFLFVLLACSPLFFRAGLLCMSDMSAAAAVTACMYYAFAFRLHLKKNHLVWMLASAALAIQFRYVSPLLVFFPVLLAGSKALRRDFIPALASGLAVAALILVPHLYLRSSTSLDFLSHPWLEGWSPQHFFQKRFDTVDGHFEYRFMNLFCYFGGVFHPGYCAVLLLLLPVTVFKGGKITFEEKTIWFSILLYLFFLSGMPLQNARFLVLVVPFLVILSFRGWLFICDTAKTWMTWSALALVFIVQIIFFTNGFMLVTERFRLERAVYEKLSQDKTHPVLYSFDLDVSLKGYGLNKQVYSLWEKQYDHFGENSLVLFNPEKFSRQWAGKNPMLNWEKLSREYHLIQIAEFAEGWKLYEIR